LAKILEHNIVIKFSKLVKDNSNDSEVVSADVLANLEQVVQELAGDTVMIEIIEE